MTEAVPDRVHPTDVTEAVPDRVHPTDVTEAVPDRVHPTDVTEAVPDRVHPTDATETLPGRAHPVDETRALADRAHPAHLSDPPLPTAATPPRAHPLPGDSAHSEPPLSRSGIGPDPSPELPPVTVGPGAGVSGGVPSRPVRGAHLLRITVPAHPSRVPGVRAMVAEHLTRLRLPPERVDDAVLAAGELFTNALRHGSLDRGDTVTVVVECGPRELWVSVADRSSALPAARTAAGAEESGRGLTIVAALTDEWGVARADPGTTGKKVWFSMTLQGEP
ncbi:ATP-binding protein [Streptomyces sp. NBC_00358]|uniref:ATP-binding protein n=1 Tax=Streptomyces sp. NBC_00358 TaxID=2975725 RepID=UPI002E260906